MAKSSGPEVLSLLSEFSQVSSLNEAWVLLCDALEKFGIDRAFYARKPLADLQTFHNRFRMIYFSTYGEAADRLLVEEGGFVQSHSIRWAVENSGAISWRVNRERFLNGEMSPQEEALHLGLRDIGLIAGITYGNPLLTGQVRSGFGLCFSEGLDQSDADRIWARSGDEITACLQIFELAASQFQNVPNGKTLTDRQIEMLRLTIDGKTIEEIATLLGVHRRTVESHLLAARDKLGVTTTLQAAVIATQQGQL